MQYRTISDGSTTFDVSALCLGTMFFGPRNDVDTSLACLDRVAEAGGSFVDTANNYNTWVGGHGRDSEDVLGTWFGRRGGAGSVRVANAACSVASRARRYSFRPSGTSVGSPPTTSRYRSTGQCSS